MSHKKKSSKHNKHREYVEKYKVYVDGKTEVSYFERLNNLKVFQYISFKPQTSYAEGYEYNYDKQNCCLILDVDGKDRRRQKKEYDLLEKLINHKEMTVYYTNYSFEMFLLLHKNKTVGAGSANGYYLKISRTFDVKEWSHDKNLQKRTKLCSKISKDDVLNAAENTKKYSTKKWDINPSTNLNKFLEDMKKRNEKNKNINGKDK